MGRDARRNPTAQAAQRGELMSRATILGAMDHALEVHASALRFAAQRIDALVLRVDELTRRCETLENAAGIPPPLAFHPDAFNMVSESFDLDSIPRPIATIKHVRVDCEVE